MKCPRCEFTTTKDKDECPRCGLVLLDHKKVKTNPVLKKSDFSDLVFAIEKKAENKIAVKEPPKKNHAPASEIPKIDLKDELLGEFVTHTFASRTKNAVIQEVEGNKNEVTYLSQLEQVTIQAEQKVKKASSTDLAALTALTEYIELPQIITIPEIEWKKCEIEMAKIRIANEDLGFVDVFDLQEDNEISVLFELTEREILDPTSISTPSSSSTNKAIIDTNLDQAVKEFVQAQNKDEALKKLNIFDKSIGTMVASDSINFAKIWQRVGAYQIDILLNLVLTTALAWLNILPTGIKSKIIELDKSVLFELLPYFSDILMIFILCWMLIQSVLLTTLGTTIGGKIFKIAVTDKEGYFLSFRQALLRSLSWSITILSCGLGLIMYLLKHRQTLHDRIAKTIVVKI